MTKEEIRKKMVAENPFLEEAVNAVTDMETDKVGGRVSINLDEGMYEDPLCEGFEFDEMLNDIILAEYIDENNGDVQRGGIYLPENVSQSKAWRTAIVRKVGPKVPSQIKVDSYIRFPADKGLPTIRGKKKFIFLNAERVFCTMRKI